MTWRRVQGIGGQPTALTRNGVSCAGESELDGWVVALPPATLTQNGVSDTAYGVSGLPYSTAWVA
jgi:hypothetical protein